MAKGRVEKDETQAASVLWRRFPEIARRLEEEDGLRAEKIKKRRKPKE